MPDAAFDYLPLLDRGVISANGADVVPFLDNLATTTLDGLKTGEARFAALLSPQGKIQFEFFAVRTDTGFLLDTDRTRLPDFLKRLTLYKLRAKVTLKDESDTMSVAAAQSRTADPSVIAVADPRDAGLGFRIITRDPTLGRLHHPDAEAAYHRRRLARGVPQAGIDYPLGDTFPHEANYDSLGGVSFTKGCFVGQEVVARMQNKTVVRKRVVRIEGSAPLSTGASIDVAGAEVGRIGTVFGTQGLAMLRLDRAVEAVDKGQVLSSLGAIVTPDATSLTTYRDSLARRQATVVDL